MSKVRSAAAASSIVTCSSVRFSRVHRRVPQLLRVHLAQTLVAADRWPSPLGAQFLQHAVALFIGVGVVHLVPVGDAVERRLGDVQVPFLDQRLHVAEEEGQQQGADVAAVHVGVGHDDHAAVAQAGQVEAVADAGAQRRDQRLDLVVGQDLVQPGALGVEDLAAQRQDGLEVPVAALLGRAAGRVTLDDVQLASWSDRAPSSRPACRAGSGFPGRILRITRSRALRAASRARAEVRHFCTIALAACGFSSRKVAEGLAHDLLDLGLHLGVHQLDLRLALELRIGMLDADDGRQAFARIVAAEVRIVVLEQAVAARA